MMTAHTLDFGASNRTPPVWFDRTGHDYTDWQVVRDAMRFTFDKPSRVIRAPLVAALYACDDTIMARVIGAVLDYHSTPQAANEEANGPDRLADVAATLRDAAEQIDAIAARMEERG